MKLPVNTVLPLAALIALSGCAGAGNGGGLVSDLPRNGPAADYPVVLGEPFTIGDTSYTPADRLNYDAVGYALVGQGGNGSVAAAHKTLPLPSYIELTRLDTGRTALVRVETRGPMRNDTLVEITEGAASQLGIAPDSKTPVRIRRVNPPEVERAMLRSGNEARLRMDTPKALLTVLKRNLVKQSPLGNLRNAPAIVPVDPDPVKPQRASPVAKPAVKPKAETPEPAPARPATVKASSANQAAGFYVQIGAFSTQNRANKAAGPLQAVVSKPGSLWIVRLGPYASSRGANTALEKARAAGYNDAMVRRID
ncbi:MAG: SPOR domain-containing protein [Sphingomonadaceae bacterium]|nr:SPOR domain-containing protein [Sphingomonadaceae bacterium]